MSCIAYYEATESCFKVTEISKQGFRENRRCADVIAEGKCPEKRNAPI